MMSVIPEHIYPMAETYGNAAHDGQRYIEFYGWFNPDGSSAGALGSVSAADVFGTQSSMPSPQFLSGVNNELFSGSVVLQVITVALFLLYFFMIFRFGGEIMQYLRLMLGYGKTRDRRAENDNPGTEVNLGVCVCGITGFATAFYKMFSIWGDNAALQTMPHLAPLIIIAGAAVVLLIILLLQKVILRLTGALTFNTAFINSLYNLRRSFLITVTVVATPIILLLSLSHGAWSDIFAWAVLAVTGLLATGYIIRSFLLFVGQKVSILFWILYLCAVELMPVVLVVIFIMKYTAG